MSVESCGKVIDKIDVKISYRIIELFSGGLYSSPNKAFEELVCNSYDAFADKVAVYLSPDLTVEDACIWICDNGESMDQNGLKDLWKIGESAKRTENRDEKRLQIGRFGIGKLATYVLAYNLTYICKKDGRYLATTMDYSELSNDKEEIRLDEREIDEQEVKKVIASYQLVSGRKMIPFDLFGQNAEKSWTFAIMTRLKPKAKEIKEGRLKWVLRTALPINPAFKLFFNGGKIESSKIDKPISNTWIIGKDDKTAEQLGLTNHEDKGSYYIDFENLKGVGGKIDLYEDSLLDSTKSSELGRSHGIFLMVRGRLINLDDPLLGMDAFSHGAFNRTRVIVHADGLDENLTSTREAIRDSEPYRQLKEYLKRKFNNEIRKYYFEEENRKNQERSISYRLAQTSLTISKRPLYVFAEKYFGNKIVNPILIEKPPLEMKDKLLYDLKTELSGNETFIKNVEWCNLHSSEPIAKLDLITGSLKINLFHPYIANYNDTYKSTLPLQFIAIAEVLTEAHLYELGLDESLVNIIMRRRDNTLRELTLSDREGAPIVAQILMDSIADPTGLEDALCSAFRALGFHVTPKGQKGEPDGIAEAKLGYSTSDKNEFYSFTYDAKSTKKEKIAAGTAHFSAIKRHQKKYHADYSVVISVDFQGAMDDESAVAVEARQQNVTVMTVKNLIRLVLLSVPKQIGLNKFRQLFTDCFTPTEVTEWIDNIEKQDIKIGPIEEILKIIYDLQCKDTEPPEIATVRMKLNEKVNKNYSKSEIKMLISSLNTFVPGFVSIEGERVGIQGTPEKVIEAINGAINNVPNELQALYLKAFSTMTSAKPGKNKLQKK